LAKAIPTPTSVLRCSSDFLPTEPFYQAVNPTYVPEDDGKVILAQIQGIEPGILSQIVSLKSEFDSCQSLIVSKIIVRDF
jgi:hypothetical protein